VLVGEVLDRSMMKAQPVPGVSVTLMVPLCASAA
jgi:hypothetical protein